MANKRQREYWKQYYKDHREQKKRDFRERYYKSRGIDIRLITINSGIFYWGH